jgi:CheY-like chemotaxis protein
MDGADKITLLDTACALALEFDWIIVALAMRGTNGFESWRSLHELERNSDLPVLPIMSNAGTPNKRAWYYCFTYISCT